MDVATQPDLPEDWDRLAATHGTFYHRSAWLRVLTECFGFRLHLCVATERGVLVGGLPLAEVPALVGPRRLVSLPFSYAAGTMSNGANVAAPLMLEAVARAESRRIQRIEIKTAGTTVDPAASFTRVIHYSTYRVRTNEGEGALWERLHAGSTQRSIRKAEKSGVRVERAGAVADWVLMADLQDETSHRLGVPAPPRDFFIEACRRLQGEGFADLYLAYLPSGAAAAGVTLWKGTREWIYA